MVARGWAEREVGSYRSRGGASGGELSLSGWSFRWGAIARDGASGGELSLSGWSFRWGAIALGMELQGGR